MANAKEEIMDIVGAIQCVLITYQINYDNSDTILLKEGYNQFDLDIFLKNLDFEYDDGYGHQYIYGTIWLKDGTWMERAEYDGSEWWERCVRPEVPDILK
jgi:hypothetical protein